MRRNCGRERRAKIRGLLMGCGEGFLFRGSSRNPSRGGEMAKGSIDI